MIPVKNDHDDVEAALLGNLDALLRQVLGASALGIAEVVRVGDLLGGSLLRELTRLLNQVSLFWKGVHECIFLLKIIFSNDISNDHLCQYWCPI